MYQLLFIAIFTIAGVFTLLTATIVANKAWRDGRARWRDKRRGQLEPRVLAYARGDLSIQQVFGHKPDWRDRDVLEVILLEQAQRASSDERMRLSEALHHLGYIDEYLRALRARDWWFRAEAAEKLGQSGTPRGVDALIAALNDDVSEVRLRAAKALGELGGTLAVRTLIRTLNEPSRWSTIRIAKILASRGSAIVGELESAFARMNGHARLAVLDILAEIGDIQAAHWLRTRLEDPESDVRSRAANALGAIKDEEAGPRLTELLQDPEWPVRAMSAKALGMIQFRPAISALCSTLRDPVWWVRADAADALQVMGPEGLDALKNMLDDSDTYARHQAVLMLQEAGTLDLEISSLVHVEPEKRAAARALVDRLIDDGRIGRLRDLAQFDPNPELRAKLSDLLPREQEIQEVTAR